MPFRYLSEKRQFQLMKAKNLIPSVVFLFGIVLVIFLALLFNKYENRGRHSESTLEIREYSKQLEMKVLNSIIRVQLMIEMYGPNAQGLKSQKEALEDSLRHTIFQRLSLFRIEKIKDKDGLPLIKRIFGTQADFDKLPQPTSNYLTSDFLRRKIGILESGDGANSITINHSDKSNTLILIWKLMNKPNEYALAIAPLESIFKNGPEKKVSVILEDKETEISLLIDWDVKNKFRAELYTLPKKDHKFLFSQSFLPSGDSSNYSFLVSHWYSSRPFYIGTVVWVLIPLGIIIAGLIAFLLRFIMQQNTRVADLVVRRTMDLEASLDEAMEANLSKTRFLANISHELRTPLNLILGMIDLTEEHKPGGKVGEHLQTMKVSANHLLSLIKDLLDIAQKDDSDLALKQIPIRAPVFFEEIVTLVRHDCHKKRLNIQLWLDKNIPEYFRGDPARVRQILINLLRNSIKYTLHGQIDLHVSVAQVSVDDKTLTLKMSVRDTGIGIPSSKKELIFDRFLQLESSKVLSQGGVGLGLSIVKDLVTRMDGNINVESKEGQGSDFTVELTFELLENTKKWVDSMSEGLKQDLEIALISNDFNLQKTIAEIFSSSQIDLSLITPDNIESLIMAKNFSAYDYIFTDDHMVLQKIMPLIDNKRLIYLSDTSAKNTLSVKRVDKFPLIPSQLWALLSSKNNSVVKKMYTEQPQETNLEIKNNLSILIADDDEGNRDLLKAYFANNNWNLEFADNGQTAFEIYTYKDFDIVLADLHMPVINGFELTKKIRDLEKSSQRANVPILLITADAFEETEKKAKDSGVTLFLTKPIRKAKLLEAISALTGG